MRTMISNLPSELVEEVLSRVPVKSMGEVRSTCKNWNSLSKDTSFTSKHIGKASSAREREFVMIKHSNVYLISFNLYETHNNSFDLSINRRGQLVTRETSYPVCNISQVLHSDGLLLCVFSHINYSVVVWNPYWGQRKWIKHRKISSGYDVRFAFGYENSCRRHKILMFCFYNLEIYDLSSDSWRVLTATFDRDIKIEYSKHGVSLKGNTYWYAKDKDTRDGFLLCFDFTRERFAPRLPLPFDSNIECDASLSAVRQEQLALLMQPWGTLEMEIWVTNNIEPDAVSWSKFLRVDVNPLTYFLKFTSFFIEEEKKIAVVFGQGRCYSFEACIIGENGYFKTVDLRKSADIQINPFECSYVPTSVPIL